MAHRDKKAKKPLKCLKTVIALVVACALLMPITVKSDGELLYNYYNSGIDAVVLIDVSGSMRFTDPERQTLTAAADFIDALPLGASRVGVIGFSGRMQHVIPMQGLESENQLTELRGNIESFQYIGFTDIGMALLAGAEMLRGAGELTNPMVLLISDGWIQISPSQAPRVAEDSYNDAETALHILNTLDEVPVYTIGIHNPAGVDVELLTRIAEESGGTAGFTSETSELSEMFINLLETHLELSVQMPDDVEEELQEYYEPEQDLQEPTPYEQEEQEVVQPEIVQEEYTQPEETEAYEAEEIVYPEDEPQALVGWLRNLLYGLAVTSSLSAIISVVHLIRSVTV